MTDQGRSVRRDGLPIAALLLSVIAIGIISKAGEVPWPMHETAAVAPGFSRPLVIIAAGVGVVLAATAVLWAYYGTAVFYEMIAAGIAACL